MQQPIKQEEVDGCKFIYKTSKEHTLKLWISFLSKVKTSKLKDSTK
jgi:hypothetical protein